MIFLLKGPKLLGASKITTSFSTTIPKKIRELLKLKPGSIIGFYLENGERIILSNSGKNLLGSSSLTISNSITIPKNVRELLKTQLGDQIGYYLELDNKISLQT